MYDNCCCENEKLAWIKNKLEEIIGIWAEDKERAKESEETLANDLLEKLISIKENAVRSKETYLSM